MSFVWFFRLPFRGIFDERSQDADRAGAGKWSRIRDDLLLKLLLNDFFLFSALSSPHNKQTQLIHSSPRNTVYTNSPQPHSATN